MSERYSRLETQLIHAGEPRPRIQGAVATPIFQSAMFEYEGETSYHDLKYIRLNNTPNHVALGRKVAALESAEAAVVAASGMAAISRVVDAVAHRYGKPRAVSRSCMIWRWRRAASKRRSGRFWRRLGGRSRQR